MCVKKPMGKIGKMFRDHCFCFMRKTLISSFSSFRKKGEKEVPPLSQKLGLFILFDV